MATTEYRAARDDQLTAPVPSPPRRPTGELLATPTEDEQVGAVLRVRDPSSFARLYDQHAPSVYAGALRLAGDVEAAEQMVERGFLALWRSPEWVRDTDHGLLRYLFSEAFRCGGPPTDSVALDERMQASP